MSGINKHHSRVKFGIIGYGSMGRMILNGFLGSQILQPEEVMVSTRTSSALDGLEKQWPGITVAKNNITLAQQCRSILIAVKPTGVIPLLEEIAPYFDKDTHLISIAACIGLQDIDRFFKGKVTRVIPTLISEVGEGITLVCHNDKIENDDEDHVKKLFSCFSKVNTIQEEAFEAATNMTSCAPGLIASIFQEFLAIGVKHSNISSEEAEAMLIHTLYGTSKLLYEKKISFSQIIARVATKGGITEEGVTIFRKELPSIFDEVFVKILDKYELLKHNIHQDYHANSQRKANANGTDTVRHLLIK